MKKIIILTALILFLIAGCAQQPTAPIEPTTPTEEPILEEPSQICTERWLCQDQNTKAYRKSDCTFEQITDCPAGCENGVCKEEPIKEPQLEEPKETEEKPKESCVIGWKCLDDKRLGYQSSNCMVDNVEECKYGCKEGKCITTAPQKEETEETFTLKEGKGIMGMPGWKYFDFSKEDLFKTEINDQDLKMKLYASASSYNYFRSESPISSIWAINKEITQATRADCVAEITQANAYFNLKSAQTLCIKTKEKNIALMGGIWQGLPTESTELTWKYYILK